MKVQSFPLSQFRAWLEANGASVCLPTNPYEVLRYIGADNKMGFVHRNDRDSSVKVSGSAIGDYGKFLHPGRTSSPGPQGKIRMSLFDKLVRRDGATCFFCGTGAPLTIEHLLARSHGGGNTLPNLCLACEPCNLAVGNDPLVDKMRYYVAKQKELTNVIPFPR